MSGKIVDLVAERRAAAPDAVVRSIEFFPPKTEKGVENLLKRAVTMKALDPVFIDMTWGAGGSTSDLTLDLCVKLQELVGLPANMHLTCTNMEKDKVDVALKGCQAAGIQNIVALRGDAPEGQETWEAVEGGFTCALDLVKYIREQYGDYFNLSVSGYPEGHPTVIKPVLNEDELTASERTRLVKTEDGLMVCHDEDYKKELEYLKAKVDAGSDMIITQMVFDAGVYAAFLKDCKAIGITVPIYPGIMCINAYGGFKRMTGFCKSRVPEDLAEKMEAAKDDSAQVKALGVKFGAELCQGLLDAGAPALHFYTLNLNKCTERILAELGIVGGDEPEPAVAAAN